jgi:homocitrate synthase NifV
LTPKIYLIDVTTGRRPDGAPGSFQAEKTMINLYLDDMGIYQSEFGFPTTKHERATSGLT